MSDEKKRACIQKILTHFENMGADMDRVVIKVLDPFTDEHGRAFTPVIGRYVGSGRQYWDESDYPMAAIGYYE